jgi:hypothetical protein
MSRDVLWRDAPDTSKSNDVEPRVVILVGPQENDKALQSIYIYMYREVVVAHRTQYECVSE